MPCSVAAMGSRRAAGGVDDFLERPGASDVVWDIGFLSLNCDDAVHLLGDYRRGAGREGKHCDLLGYRHRITLQKSERRYSASVNARQRRTQFRHLTGFVDYVNV